MPAHKNNSGHSLRHIFHRLQGAAFSLAAKKNRARCGSGRGLGWFYETFCTKFSGLTFLLDISSE